MTLFAAFAAVFLLAVNSGAQSYPDIRGTYELYEIYSLSSIVGGQPNVVTYTNDFMVDIIQSNEQFWIVQAGTTSTNNTRTGVLSGNSVLSMNGPAVLMPAGWVASSNAIVSASGTVYTNYMTISLDGKAVGFAQGIYPFTSDLHSDIVLIGTFHPLQPPTITSQPVSVTDVVGNTVRFSVEAGGATNFSYQWRKDGNLIPGANSATYTINSVQVTDAGTYLVHVANVVGSTNSSAVTLVVNSPPVIKTQPANLKAPYGTKATLSVKVGGTPPFQYQWLLNRTNIPDATNASYSFTALPVNGASNLLYSVQIANLYGSVLSTNAIVTITHDTTAPAVTIVAPAAGARLTNVQFSGVATDNGTVAGVTYRVTHIDNGTSQTGADIAATIQGTTPARQTWSATPDLLPGTNIVSVFSVDLQGNQSKVATRQFFYRSLSSLVLTTNGAGKISGKSSAAGASEPVPAAGTTRLYIGQGYSVQAAPAANWLFSNWIKSVDGASLAFTNQTLSFVMEPGLTLTANFVTNPFVALANTYSGAFSSEAVSPESSGLLNNLVLNKSGSFTCQLVVNGVGYTVIGGFDLTGHFRKTISRTALAGGPVTLDITIGSQDGAASITGTVAGGSWTSALVARPATTSLASGQHTVIIPPGQSGPTGYGIIAVANTGAKAVLTVKLADATALTLAATVLADGSMPFYAPLYNGAGVLVGSVYMTNTDLGGTAVWIKKQSSAPYPGGFTNSTGLMTSKWIAPAVKTPALPFTSANPGLLLISAPAMPALLSFQVAVLANNTVVKLPSSDATNSLTGTVDPKTGIFKLTYGTTGRLTASATGAVLQATQQGFGFCGAGTNFGPVTLMPAQP